MWMKMSHQESGRPASSTSTLESGFSLRRFASTHPALPPPTITKSYSVFISERRRQGAQLHVNGFHPRIMVQRLEPVFAAQAGAFHAAERDFHRRHVVGVDPAGAGVE